MPDKSWKAFERRVSSLFGTIRNPLSGINSTITGSDTQHKDLFVECKLRAKCAANSLFQETKPKAVKESKLPVLALQKKNAQGFLVCVHSEDLKDFVEILYKQWEGTDGEEKG